MAGRMLLVPVGVVAVTLASCSGEVLDLLYATPAGGAVTAFALLMMTLIPVGLIYIYTTMLTAAGRMKRLGIITLAGMVMNIVLNLILIPRCQAPGAAWAAFSTQSLVALASFLAVERNLLSRQSVKLVSLFALMLLAHLCGRTAGSACRHALDGSSRCADRCRNGLCTGFQND